MSKPYAIRLLTLGDSGAGKSTLLLKYTQNEFDDKPMPTIGIDFRLKKIKINEKEIKVQIWDSAGQERFRTVTRNYYRGAAGVVLVYDVTNEQSFENIRHWISDIQTYAESDVDLMLIGNKCDLQDKRAVDKEKGEALAKEYGVKFFETSAKSDINVTQAFDCLVKQVAERVYKDLFTKKDTIKLDAIKEESKGKCC